MIPQEKSAAVTRGLREAFDIGAFENIRRVSGGHTSSLVFRIVVRGRPFLLKIILRSDDPTCHFTCMKGGGCGPGATRSVHQCRGSDLHHRLCGGGVFSGNGSAYANAAGVAELHALPPFPTRAPHLNTSCTFLLNKEIGLDGLVRRFQAANFLPKGESDELFTRYMQVAAAYPRHDLDLVSSHNDLFKPDNILFDGERVWLVDWEAAFLNDRYADLAVVANLVASNEEEETVFLQEYFGEPPDSYRLARFFLAQQIAHMFYTMVFFLFGSSGKPVDCSETALSYTELHRRFWTGKVTLENKEAKTAYGRVHWERLLQNMRQPRFNEALKIVSDRHTCT